MISSAAAPGPVVEQTGIGLIRAWLVILLETFALFGFLGGDPDGVFLLPFVSTVILFLLTNPSVLLGIALAERARHLSRRLAFLLSCASLAAIAAAPCLVGAMLTGNFSGAAAVWAVLIGVSLFPVWVGIFANGSAS